MAVAFDAVGPSAAGINSATSPLTWTHSPVGTPSDILIGITSFSGSSNLVTAVTYGGVSCALVGYQESATAAAGGIALYHLGSPPAGNQTVSVTFTGAADTIGGSMSFTGGGGGLGTPLLVASSGSATSVSGSVTGTTTGGMIGAAACFGTPTTFAGTNSVTVRWQLSVTSSSASDNEVGGTVPSTGGGASQTVGFTGTPSSDDWGFIAVEILPFTGVLAGLATATAAVVQAEVINQFTASLSNAVPGVMQVGFIPGTPPAGGTPSLTVNAGLASASGASGAATDDAVLPAGLAAGAGAAAQPATPRTPGLATAAGTSQSPSGTAVIKAGLATAPGAGQQPVNDLVIAAGLATAAGAAGTAGLTFTPGLATGSGTSQSPSDTAVIPAGLATGAGAGQSPSNVLIVNAGLATAAGAAGITGLTFTPGLATAAGTSQAPGVTSITPSGLATGSGTSNAPVPALEVQAGLASAVGSALQPSIPGTTVISAGLATAAGAALGPVSDAILPAGLATGSGTSNAPGDTGIIHAGLASGVASSQSPAADLTAGAGLATGSGAAFAPSIPPPGREPLALGGSLDTIDLYNGMLSENDLGGSVSYGNVLGGGAVIASLDNFSGGSATLVSLDTTSGGTGITPASTLGGGVSYGNTLGGSLIGWTMQQVNLTLAENNDETVNVAITSSSSPLDISEAVINFYLKTAAGTADDVALVLTSSGGSPAITITNGPGGLCTVQIPHMDLTTEQYTFYRVDVVFSGLQNTAIYGNITWITL